MKFVAALLVVLVASAYAEESKQIAQESRKLQQQYSSGCASGNCGGSWVPTWPTWPTPCSGSGCGGWTPTPVLNPVPRPVPVPVGVPVPVPVPVGVAGTPVQVPVPVDRPIPVPVPVPTYTAPVQVPVPVPFPNPVSVPVPIASTPIPIPVPVTVGVPNPVPVPVPTLVPVSVPNPIPVPVPVPVRVQVLNPVPTPVPVPVPVSNPVSVPVPVPVPITYTVFGCTTCAQFPSTPTCGAGRNSFGGMCTLNCQCTMGSCYQGRCGFAPNNQIPCAVNNLCPLSYTCGYSGSSAYTGYCQSSYGKK